MSEMAYLYPNEQLQKQRLQRREPSQKASQNPSRKPSQNRKQAGFTLPEIMLASALLVTTLVFFIHASAQVSALWWHMERSYRADAELQQWLLQWQQQPPQQTTQGQLSDGRHWQITPQAHGWSWQVRDSEQSLVEQGWYTHWGEIILAH